MKVVSDRISIVEKEGELSIVISACNNKRRRQFMTVILALWILGGITFAFSFSSLKTDDVKMMVLIWLAFWLYFLYVIVKSWRWNIYGNEIIKIRNGKLFYKKDVKGRGWVLDYDLEQIRDMRIKPDSGPNWIKQFGGDYWSTDADSIHFIHNGSEIPFGFQLKKEEAEKVIKNISRFVLKTMKQQQSSGK